MRKLPHLNMEYCLEIKNNNLCGKENRYIDLTVQYLVKEDDCERLPTI